ncbi:MAG: C39 family peptidase [Candidatus Dojkabacteria bacterium]
MNNGVAIYNSSIQEVRIISGVIYTSWLAKCSTYGFPENDTSNVNSGVSTVTGQAQRFNLNRPNIYDFYTSGYGLFILEGPTRNLYESANGLGETGFPKSYGYSDPEGLAGLCMDTEKGRICQNTYPEWYLQLQAKFVQLGKSFDYINKFNLCNNNLYTAINLPNNEGVVYYDSNYRNVRVITGAIYAQWKNGGECNTYGLPENDTTRVSGFNGISGYQQRFNKNQLQFDFYQKDGSSVTILEGDLKNKYENKGGLSRLGFIHSSYNAPLTAAGRCNSTGSYWEVDNGRIYRNGSNYHLVYGDSPIGNYFYQNGADTKFGLPMNDESQNGTYYWQDFAITRLELIWPGGVGQTTDTTYCPGEEPQEPEPPVCIAPQVWDEIKNSCVDPIPTCPVDEVWNGVKCIKPGKVFIDGVPLISQSSFGGDIAASGCAITSAAMVFTFFGHPTSPEDIYNAQGYSCYADWGSMLPLLGIDDLKLDTTLAYQSADYLKELTKNYIERGIPVILGADQFRIEIPGGGSFIERHWVVIVGYDNDGYYVNNPSFGTNDYISYNDAGRQFQHIKVFVKK